MISTIMFLLDMDAIFQHRSQPLRYFCLTCNLAVCIECTQVDHAQPKHQYELISNVAEKQMVIMETLVQDARLKHSELLETYKVYLIIFYFFWLDNVS